MYSNIQSINSTPKSLETEATDARLRNKAKQDEIIDQDARKRQQDGFSQEPDNETNIFSVNALICFLEDFLEARLSSKLNKDVPPNQKVSSFAPWMKADHSNANDRPHVPANRAANAYAHGAETVKGVVRGQEPSTTGHHLNDDNMNDVYHLLRDLRDLRDDGQKQLRLDAKLTFMDGVYSAVQDAKIKASAD